MTPNQHRKFNSIILIIAIVIGTIAISMNNHDIHDCEERLYKKLLSKEYKILGGNSIELEPLAVGV